jgi:hypothetical protein
VTVVGGSWRDVGRAREWTSDSFTAVGGGLHQSDGTGDAFVRSWRPALHRPELPVQERLITVLIQSVGMSTACTYCSSDVTRHEPVIVQEGWGDDREAAGQFCNYACLSAHINQEGLTTDDCCEWKPE